MLVTTRNYDAICLHMRNYLPQQESHIRQETKRFIARVKTVIGDGAPIKSRLDQFIPQIFNFRMLALKWLAKQPDLDIAGLIESTVPTIELLQGKPDLALLAENMMFAVRCNKRVVDAVAGKGAITSEQIAEQFAAAPIVTYEQFLGTLAFSIPDDAAVQLITDWLHTSLYIEFILLSGVLIDEENMTVSPETINELSFLVADAAQEYFAIATQMGILPAKSKTLPLATVHPASVFEDDSLLSDLGLSDFALNF